MIWRRKSARIRQDRPIAVRIRELALLTEN
jgi:hypothetical protein